MKSKSDKSASTKEERGGSKGDKRDGSIKEERSGSKSEKRDATIKEERSATPEAQKRRSGKKPEPSLDDQIAALQPVEGILLFLFVYIFIFVYFSSLVYFCLL